MNLPKFLICTSSELSQTLILSTEYPYAIGKVWLFKSEEECLSLIATLSDYARVIGYNIIIAPGDQLHPTSYNYDKEKMVLLQMAEFFLKERIERKRGYYKRYKAQNDVSDS